tara:strand:+ start:424 stop:858 length:435 start_codon:yes stop_codon:yes gene_type:complete
MVLHTLIYKKVLVISMKRLMENFNRFIREEDRNVYGRDHTEEDFQRQAALSQQDISRAQNKFREDAVVYALSKGLALWVDMERETVYTVSINRSKELLRKVDRMEDIWKETLYALQKKFGEEEFAHDENYSFGYTTSVGQIGRI